MAEVKVLIEGYTSADSPEESSCSTVTLIKDGNLVMVVDPGTLRDQKNLVDKLREEGLGVDDVNVVCIKRRDIIMTG